MILHDLIVSLYGETTYQVLAFVVKLYPLWLPLTLGLAFWEGWVRYIRWNFFVNTPITLLEIKLPKEILKSPVAMDLALTGFYLTGGEGTFFDKYWLGKTRPWFSLELVSFGGEVHFYIWTRQNARNIIESYLYSQYPGIEIREADDYAKHLLYDPSKNEMWATNYKFSQPNPFPLKTYVDYGLDKDPDEENENDPLAPMIEMFGSIKPNEMIAMQYVIRAHKKEKRGGFFSKADDFTKRVKNERKKIIETIGQTRRPTLTESKLIEALERSLQKHVFDTGIRVIYFAKEKSAYDNTTVTSIRNIFRPFSAAFSNDKDPDLASYARFNSIGPTNDEKTTDFDYPWQDYKGIRMIRRKTKQLDAFKRRMFFYAPYVDHDYLLTTEELATLFHFPGSVVSTPGLDRIQSKRGEAPTNLPT